jgi:quercetin dioxygenase-like cupin family protein
MDASQESNTQAAVHRIRRGEGRTVRLFGLLEWKLMPAQTEGHYCLLETVVAPGMGVPPHQHADQEAFYVLEGSLEVARLGPGGLEFFPATAGDFINVPSNEVHGFRNPGGAPARILVMATAGLGAFFLEAGVPVLPGEAAPTGPPSQAEIERILAVARKHGHRFLAPPA